MLWKFPYVLFRFWPTSPRRRRPFGTCSIARSCPEKLRLCEQRLLYDRPYEKEGTPFEYRYATDFFFLAIHPYKCRIFIYFILFKNTRNFKRISKFRCCVIIQFRFCLYFLTLFVCHIYISFAGMYSIWDWTTGGVVHSLAGGIL